MLITSMPFFYVINYKVGAVKAFINKIALTGKINYQ